MDSSTFQQQVTEVSKIQEITEAVPVLKNPAYSEVLAKECEAFTHYLISQQPTGYVIQKYCDAHRVNDVFVDREIDKFDQFLLRIAEISPFFTKVVDVYTAFLYKPSVFRAKIVLLMAILESCSPSYLSFEEPDADGPMWVGISIFGQGIFFVLTLLLSLITLLPAHLVFLLIRNLSTGVKS